MRCFSHPSVPLGGEGSHARLQGMTNESARWRCLAPSPTSDAELLEFLGGGCTTVLHMHVHNQVLLFFLCGASPLGQLSVYLASSGPEHAAIKFAQPTQALPSKVRDELQS